MNGSRNLEQDCHVVGEEIVSCDFRFRIKEGKTLQANMLCCADMNSINKWRCLNPIGQFRGKRTFSVNWGQYPCGQCVIVWNYKIAKFRMTNPERDGHPPPQKKTIQKDINLNENPAFCTFNRRAIIVWTSSCCSRKYVNIIFRQSLSSLYFKKLVYLSIFIILVLSRWGIGVPISTSLGS